MPLGRFPVRERVDVDLLEELDRVLARIDRFARGFKSEAPPPRFSSLRRQIDGSVYEFVLRGEKDRLQNVLAAIGRMERYFAQRDLKLEPKLDSPLGGLSTRWLLAANDRSPNFRIAVSLASILRSGDVGSIRANLTPIHPKEPWKWAIGAGQTAWTGSNLAQRMVSVLKRRMMDGERLNCESLPLWGAVRAQPGDAVSFLENDGIDESRIEDLLFGLTLVEWHDKEALDQVKPELYSSWRSEPSQSIVPREYAVLKHLFHSGVETETRPEPAILSLLTGNRIGDACEVAMRRLRVSGRAPVKARFSGSVDGTRLAASLLIPITVPSIEALSRLVLHEQEPKVAAQTKRMTTHV